MKHIKLFERFSGTQNISEMYYGGKYDFLGSFGLGDFEMYSDIVKKWEMKTGKSVKNLDKFNTYKELLNGNKSIVLVETDEDLIFVLIDNNNRISYNTHSSFGHENVFNQNYVLVNFDTPYNSKERIKKVVYENI
jgi:hypothetical protein